MTAPIPAKKLNKAAKTAAKVVSKRKKIDWEAVERDYRTGRFTLRELESAHGVSYAQISRKATNLKWEKDLREVIKKATNAALLHEGVTLAQKDATNTILVAAEIGKNVILGHRKGLTELDCVKRLLLGQIQAAAQNLPALAEVIEMVRMPDDNGIDRANDALKKAMSRSALVDDLKKLADVDEKVRKGEREAFDLNDAPPDDRAKESAINEMLATMARSVFPVAK